jgi:GT2 family glycosyltransferase
MTTLRASVIIPLWNGAGDIAACLDALLAQAGVDVEVVVVDNGSEDDGAALVAARYPAVRLLRNDRNLGFAGGCNVGLRAARGDALVLLNQDTEVQPGWLAALLTALDAPDVGIAGSVARYPDGAVQHAGGTVDARGEARHLTAPVSELRDVDFVTGASLAISRRAYAAVGPLDEVFSPAYFEDVDWCYRARRAGFRVVLAPRSVLVHKEVSAGAGEGHAARYGYHRHRLRFVLKHWSPEALRASFLPAERAWLDGLGEGSEGLVAALRHAYLYHLLHPADVVRWRARTFDVPPPEAGVVDVLLALRARLPRAGLDRPEARAREAALLAELRERREITPQPFHSEVPVLGPLIAAFRSLWSRVAVRGYVMPLVEQQVRVNERLLAMLEHLHYEQARIRAVFAEYVAENGRELDELAQAMARDDGDGEA